MPFGEKIKELREKRVLSQQDLADSINQLCGTQLKRNTISNYERNKSFPDHDKLIAIVKILDTSSDVLLGLNFKSQVNRRLSSNSDGIIYSEIAEEPLVNEELTSVNVGVGFSPELRECRYILANGHNVYAKNCNDIAYIDSLPSIKIPHCGTKQLRAFQLSRELHKAMSNWKINIGDILIGEKTKIRDINPLAPFYVTVWKNIGLKILRYHELSQLIDLPDILETWIPKSIINYKITGT